MGGAKPTILVASLLAMVLFPFAMWEEVPPDARTPAAFLAHWAPYYAIVAAYAVLGGWGVRVSRPALPAVLLVALTVFAMYVSFMFLPLLAAAIGVIAAVLLPSAPRARADARPHA